LSINYKYLNRKTNYYAKNWTKDSHLSGGDFNPEDINNALSKALKNFKFLSEEWTERIN
jgi:hypothetical protein